MVAIETDLQREGDVTFVQARVTNARSTRQRVQLRCVLDGPVHPPRRDDVPVPEWDGDTWTSTLEPDETIGLGFVTPAPPEEPALELVSQSRAEDQPSVATTRDVMASLDGAKPPRDLGSGGR